MDRVVGEAVERADLDEGETLRPLDEEVMGDHVLEGEAELGLRPAEEARRPPAELQAAPGEESPKTLG